MGTWRKPCFADTGKHASTCDCQGRGHFEIPAPDLAQAQAIVKARWPEAVWVHVGGEHIGIFTHEDSSTLIGSGEGRELAWDDAAWLVMCNVWIAEAASMRNPGDPVWPPVTE